MKLRYFVGLLLVILMMPAVFVGGYWLGQSSWAPINLAGTPITTPEEVEADFEPFWEVWQLIHQEYFQQPVDDNLLVEGAISGMLETLEDQNTVYLPPQQQASLEESISGEFEGIGAEVESIDGAITIVAPIDGSPAEEAGLRTGDILRKANGTELTGMDLFEAASLVRGPAGTDVELLVERDGELFDLSVTRGVIKLPSVRGEMLEEGIAYVRLSRFGETTPQELEEILQMLMAENPSGLILDLRQNPGGILDTAVSAADQFLSRGPILIESFGSGREREFTATNNGLAEDVPMVVLIDEGSASASEVLAGALRDRGRSDLIGQTSFGKGTVQTWRVLSNGGGVRLTIARWLTPDRVWVHQEGLDPDYFIPLPELVDEGDPQDTQLEAAIDYLRGESIESIPPTPTPAGETSEQE